MTIDQEIAIFLIALANSGTLSTEQAEAQRAAAKDWLARIANGEALLVNAPLPEPRQRRPVLKSVA